MEEKELIPETTIPEECEEELKKYLLSDERKIEEKRLEEFHKKLLLRGKKPTKK